MHLKKNIGTTDRNLRIIAAIIFLIIAFMNGGWWWLLGLFAVILLVTAFIGWCPPYAAVGISTVEKDKTTD